MDDEKYYEAVDEEIRSGNLKRGLWFKALVQANNDETQAKVLYVKWRVQHLVDEERCGKA
jgi:hypothetical protein